MRYIVIMLLMSGCFMTGTKKVETKTKDRHAIIVDIKPLEGPEFPEDNMRLTVDGRKYSLPSRSGVKINDSESIDILSSISLSRKNMTLIMLGAVCLAAGAVMCYFGMWTMGIGVILFGGVILTCAVVMDKYPWVFLILLLLILIAGIYVAWALITGQSKSLVLKKVCARIDALKSEQPDVAKRHITDPLAKDNNSNTIAAHTRKARDA